MFWGDKNWSSRNIVTKSRLCWYATQVLHEFRHASHVRVLHKCVHASNFDQLKLEIICFCEWYHIWIYKTEHFEHASHGFTWLPMQVLWLRCSTIFKTEPCIVSKLSEVIIILIWLCSYIHCLWTFIIKYCPYFGGYLSVQNVPYFNEYLYLNKFLFIICC